ncbi:MAG: tripartite tricarboxylate transporter substrate binding protein [Betaproteobacteria bacterium]|nr:MAG: tripartite tricarboxylate transporter substrate binding protein [Betaproteobacteria bacterium]
MQRFRSAALWLLFFAASICAQEPYPGKPVRIIVGYSAGGGNDLIVRVMAPRLSEGLGQPVIIENKPGAQAIIATEYVAKAAPDGYTILMGPTGPMAMNPATYARLPYSSTRDFAPISTIGQFPLIVTVGASLPVHSVRELIEYAKRNPAKANYGSSAAAFQIATELFKQKTGTGFVHIPYKSSGESVQAVVAGQVTMTICDPPPASGPLRAGTARALAITSAERHPSWPDVPTLAEAGVPDVEVWLWTAFFAARTPPAIVARLQKETARVVRLPDVREGLAKLGVDPVGGSPEELGTRLARDIEKWTAVARAANIRNE